MKNIITKQNYIKPVAKYPSINNLITLCVAAQFVEGKLLDSSSYENFTHSETGPFKAYNHIKDTNLQTSNAFFAQKFKRRIPAVNLDISPGFVAYTARS